jgi:hypothetical protein
VRGSDSATILDNASDMDHRADSRHDFVVTIMSGLLLDFLRNARPKISYSVKEAVDIDLGDNKHVGAYVVSVLNKSKRVVKELTCHVEAGPAKLRSGGVATSQGLQVDIQESDTCLSFSIPYLKTDERLEMTVVAEGMYIPRKPEVAIRSPHDIDIVGEGSVRQSSVSVRFAIAGIVAALVGLLVQAGVGGRLGKLDQLDQRDNLTFAASVSGLPKLAEIYATAPTDLRYFSQGDLAYALAVAASDRSEIEKYRKLLSVTLEGPATMETMSRAKLYYSKGKIDLLLGDKDNAVRDFREAISLDKSMIAEKSKQDAVGHEFLVSNGLH